MDHIIYRDKTVNRRSFIYCSLATWGVRTPQESLHWSDYRKYLPDQFIRIRLKIEQNCRLVLDIFSSAIMNDLFMTFTSRLKVDARCVYQQ